MNGKKQSKENQCILELHLPFNWKLFAGTETVQGSLYIGTQQRLLLHTLCVVTKLMWNVEFVYFWRSSFLTSWQKGLKLSVTPLNKSDVLSKKFSGAVVWQGSLVFNEVHCFVISFLRGLVFLKRAILSSSQFLFNSFLFHVHVFSSYLSWLR